MKTAFTLSLIIITSICAYAQKTKLELRLQKDSTYYLSTRSSNTVIEKIEGHEQVLSMILSGRVSHKVVAINDSLYVLDVRYESFSFHAAISDKPIFDMDSEDKNGNNIISRVCQVMLHKSMTVIISKAGKVLKITRPDNFFSDIFAAFPQLNEAQKTLILRRLEQNFNDNSYKSSFQDAFAVFSNVTVGLNDHWVVNTTMEGTIVANIATNYVLQEITGNNLVIHGNAQISAAGDPLYKQMFGMDLRVVNVAGTESADYKVDRATGWVTYAQVTKNIKADMIIKDGPKTPGGLVFPIVADIAYTMSSK
jgi:hypothetical protein